MQELERWLDEATDARWTNSPKETNTVGEIFMAISAMKIFFSLARIPPLY